VVQTVSAKNSLPPELDQLIARVAAHYYIPPEEVELMKRDAAKEPDEALICFRDIAERKALLVADSTGERKPELTQAKVYCSACRNLCMSELQISSVGRRYVWGCARGQWSTGILRQSCTTSWRRSPAWKRVTS
jgi:hypothetical protein